MTRSGVSRRRLLVAVGAGTGAALAGCTGDAGIDGDPEYEAGEIGNVDGEARTAEEMATAEALAEQEINEGVTPLDDISLTDHEFVFEDDYRGSTVQGTVENVGSDRIELAEVRVRVYNDDGEQIGRYLATTGDLDADTTWEFQVVILEAPEDLAEYDITALGTPT